MRILVRIYKRIDDKNILQYKKIKNIFYRIFH